MLSRLGCAVVCLAVFASCASSAEPTAADPTVTDATASAADPAPAPASSPTFRRGTAIIETDGGAVMVEIEVADTPEQQTLGLMHRESLAADAGMVFLFFEETQAGFWMRNTLIPLSIAFFDRSGEILEILDMDPCEADPCETYTPGVTYQGALEVNQGAFEEWGVNLGDRIRVSP